jgi:ABC-type oligopeptide transport system substrate-binding subunit
MILAILGFAFSLAACGGEEDVDPKEDPVDVTCEEDPTQDKCEEPEVTCEEDPTQDKCEVTCEEDPTQEKCEVNENTLPVITAADININPGEAFDPLLNVTATDEEDGDLTASVTVSGMDLVDNEMPGDYTLTYTVVDSEGGETTVTVTVTVGAYTFVLPENGFYNFKFADTEIRHDLMAAAEKYIMNNMYGGVPLFASGSFNLYSSRLQLPVDEYVAVMGYGTSFGTMSEDDSQVLMDDGLPGNAGEYTYRSSNNPGPVTFNQWLYDTSTDSDYMSLYYDALYAYVFNADKTGYEVKGSMADGDPVPVNPTTTESGKEVANTWRISLRQDLEWYFHPNTDAAFLATNPDLTINAHDFIDTYELALSENWFRAVSGGGDFCQSSTNEVVGACDFSAAELEVPGSGDFSTVGLKVVDDYTIEFTFVDEQSNWNVRYFLSSFVTTPVNLELYNYYEANLTGEETNPYGTDVNTIGYHGAYYIDNYEVDKIVRYLKNPSYHTPDEYFYTGYNFAIIEDSTTIFNEFIAGKLEATGLPTAEVDNYINHPGLKKIPGATTYRMMINGFGTVEAQRETFPTGTWVPEPILGITDFKMAMFHAIDRETLAEDILKVRTTNMFYFSNAYLVDAELGTPYRATEQGISVGEGLFADTYGYNFDYARQLYLDAVAELIANGDVNPGTESNPTIITLELNNYSNSESWDLACGYLKTTFEETFVDETNWVQIQVDIYTKDFPAIYYDYMMIGEFDLSVGGISGSTLDAASFLDTYSSDNRSGFTINWGFDTGIADMDVVYHDKDGNLVTETWAYDALVSALNGEVFVQDGMEADVPGPKDITQTPTTITFTVSEFNNAAYENLTYTLQYYSLLDDAYYDVDGFVNVAITTETTTITGVTPGWDPGLYRSDADYVGDYQLVINYDYTGTDKDGSSTSSWWFQPSTVAEVTDASTETTLDVTLVLTEGFVANVASVKLLDVDYVDTMEVVTVNGLQLTAANLTAETSYILEITYDDGTVDMLLVATAAAPAA